MDLEVLQEDFQEALGAAEALEAEVVDRVGDFSRMKLTFTLLVALQRLAQSPRFIFLSVSQILFDKLNA